MHEDGSKKHRKFSPSQAGKQIVNQIKNRGIQDKDETDESDESDESVLEETVHSPNERASHEPVIPAANTNA